MSFKYLSASQLEPRYPYNFNVADNTGLTLFRIAYLTGICAGENSLLGEDSTPSVPSVPSPAGGNDVASRMFRASLFY